MKKSSAKSVLIAGALALGLSSAPASAGKDPCVNCQVIAQWYWENTDMSADEVAGWLILCYQVWGCYGF